MKNIILILGFICFLNIDCYSQEKQNKCQIQGFTTSNIDIFNEINGTVIMKLYLPYGVEGAEHIFDIKQANDKWLQIEIPTLYNLAAWIHAGDLSVATRNYNNEPISLYQKANKESKIKGVLKGQQIVKIYSGDGHWAYVKGKDED